MAKYVAVRVPLVAYQNLLRKKARMEKVVRVITRKQVSIPLTKVLVAVTGSRIYFPDDYVLKLTKKKIKEI